MSVRRAWIAATVLTLLPAPGLAGPPGQVVRELALWRQAVQSENPVEIAGRMVKGQVIVFRRVGDPQAPVLKLDRAGLRKRLEAGQADPLGLARSLLLPRTTDLKKDADGRWVATDSRCPEVRWIFEKRGARWRLSEVQRHLLEC